MILKIKKLSPNAIIPKRATEASAGLDLCSCIDSQVELKPGEILLIPTGLAIEIPHGQAGLIFARSGLSTKHGVALANGVGLIDSDYRGEIKIGLINNGSAPYVIVPGDRVAQLVISPVSLPCPQEVEELSDTARGEGGFGSTGKK